MKTLLLIPFLLTSITIHCQKQGTIATEYSHFQLKLKKDTIDFVVADTSLTVTKPILLFCQGSQPVPLFFDIPNQGIVPVTLNNFDVNEMKKDYHVVVISMPKTPVIVGLDHLNRSYNYVLDPAQEYSYSPDYIEGDYLENYVNRANAVLKFLSKQKWVDSDQLIVAGHSQGTHVALSMAASNKKITQLGLFGFNPLGRIDQTIRQARKDAELGKITWVQADSIQKSQYQFYREINDADSLNKYPQLKSWQSFSKSQVDLLVNLKIPVYIAYGTEDITADFCDIIPLYFIENHKTNLTTKRYLGLEHNFFPIKEDGSMDYENGQWVYVMDEFVKWTIK